MYVSCIIIFVTVFYCLFVVNVKMLQKLIEFKKYILSHSVYVSNMDFMHKANKNKLGIKVNGCKISTKCI
jgi:hypothetical protein